MKWNRWRFCTRAEDYRPIVFNPSYPWWCSGYGADDGSSVIVAFLPVTEKLETYWDDAYELSVQVHDAITFSERFPRPDYFVELEPKAKGDANG